MPSVEMRLQKQKRGVLRMSDGTSFDCRLIPFRSNFTQNYGYLRILSGDGNMDVSERHGMSLQEAFRHLATEAERAELDRHSDCWKWLSRPVVYQVGAPAQERERAGRYFQLLKTLEQRLLTKLRSGDMVATALELPLTARSGRTEVSCDAWEILELNFLEATASGGRLTLIKIEVWMASETLGVAPPADPDDRQHQTAPPPSETRLHLSADDDILTIGSEKLILTGEIQQSILRQLVDAFPSGERLKTKAVLEKAGSNADSIAKAFHGSPNWKHLKRVIQQKQGYCWLEI
jgi:hypothetical protein